MRFKSSRRRSTRVAGVVATVGLVSLGFPALNALPASAATTSFSASGEHSWTVPAGVTTVSVEVGGGEGGTTSSTGGAGTGATVSGDLAVTPGQTLYAEVDTAGSGGNAGHNAGAGGTSSDIRTTSCGSDCFGSSTLSSRLVVAAGGGGGGASGVGSVSSAPGANTYASAGGDGAPARYLAGHDGTNGQGYYYGRGGYGGGSFGGSGGDGYPSGIAGSVGRGGNGAGTEQGGGGGGGGYTGGGGGGGGIDGDGGGGGGAGLSYVGALTNVSVSTGSYQPHVTFSYTTPVFVPGAPTIGAATPGNGSATVSFTAPVSNGGESIDYYTVTSSPGGLTQTGSTSPITVSGLTNGSAYTFRVTAHNSAGDSISSDPSAPVTPAAAPSAPSAVTAVRGNASAVVSFTAPSSTNGAPVTDYTVTSSPGGVTAHGTTSPITVTGLTNGTGYTFSVTATNTGGTSSASSPSAQVTPAAVPSAPSIGAATRGNGKAAVTFTAPAANGSPITGYTVTASPGGQSQTGTTSPIEVDGLTNGSTYTFTVTATNAVGTSVASAPTNQVVPASRPGVPSSVVATRGNESASVAFVAPDTGGDPITGYTVIASPGGVTASGSGSPIVINDLHNGTEYTFRVTATNTVGTSILSSPSNPITPANVPGLPTAVTAETGVASATVSFTAPTETGGSPITSYLVTASPGGTTATGMGSPIVVNGLTNGTSYTFVVQAINGAGTSLGSAPSAGVVPHAATSPGTANGYTIVNDGTPAPVPAFREVPNPISGIVPTPGGGGAWTLTNDGGVFTKGDAPFLGSMADTKLNSPMVGIASTTTGDGYWLVGSDGGVFSFGDANYKGSMGGTQLNAPVKGLASTCSGNGYYLVAADGGVFAFGDAVFYGSKGGQALNKPIVSITATCNGYYLLAEDGGVFNYGDAGFYGSAVGSGLGTADALIPTSTYTGYYIADKAGNTRKFGN